jgi:hypothetical protein
MSEKTNVTDYEQTDAFKKFIASRLESAKDPKNRISASDMHKKSWEMLNMKEFRETV